MKFDWMSLLRVLSAGNWCSWQTEAPGDASKYIQSIRERGSFPGDSFTREESNEEDEKKQNNTSILQTK